MIKRILAALDKAENTLRVAPLTEEEKQTMMPCEIKAFEEGISVWEASDLMMSDFGNFDYHNRENEELKERGSLQ